MSASHNVRMMLLKLAIAGAVGSTAGVAMAADEAEDTKSPMETAETAEKGTLKNPYKPTDADVAAEGKEIYMAAGCNGCHGGTGGGGMGPPLTNPIWIYGNDDDTLFRLIALGTRQVHGAGLYAKGIGSRGRPHARPRDDHKIQRRHVEDDHLDPLAQSVTHERPDAAAWAVNGLAILPDVLGRPHPPHSRQCRRSRRAERAAEIAREMGLIGKASFMGGGREIAAVQERRRSPPACGTRPGSGGTARRSRA